jgi:hypothetical protein
VQLASAIAAAAARRTIFMDSLFRYAKCDMQALPSQYTRRVTVKMHEMSRVTIL